MGRRPALRTVVSENEGLTFHAEVMPPAQADLLRRLGRWVMRRNFYLGGGTAIAIQLGHRRSVDLDWFTREPIPDPLRLAEAIRGEGVELEVESVDEGTLHARVAGVKSSFLEYRYPMLRPLEEWSEYGCRLAALEDLTCMKLSAIASRGSKRDFLDIHALGRTGIDLATMLEWYREKYGTGDVAHVVMSLTYFDDAESEDMPELLIEVDWGEVRRTIERWVLEYSAP